MNFTRSVVVCVIACATSLVGFRASAETDVGQSDTACATVLGFNGGMGRDTQVATILGRAALYPGNAEIGTSIATKCLLSTLAPGHVSGPTWLGPEVSDALLVLMMAEPSLWFEVASTVDRSWIDAWLRKPIRLTQLRGLGMCPTPDRYRIAAAILGNLRFDSQDQEALRLRIIKRLAELHCRTAT